MSGLVIFGSGRMAEVVDFYLATDESRPATAFCVDGEFLDEPMFAGRPVIASTELMRAFPPDRHEVFVALGYGGMNEPREEKCRWLRGLGFTLVSHVSPRAIVAANVAIGWNVLVLEGATVGPFARIGSGAILWSGTRVGHHASVGSFAFLASEAAVASGAQIGRCALIGTNATVRDDVTLGDHTLVGAGATILDDTRPGSVFRAAAAEQSQTKSWDRGRI